MATANVQITKLVNKANKIADKEVERLARNVLVKNPKATEFIMAMGSWFFTIRDKVARDHEQERLKGYKPLKRFIDKWDDVLHITGGGMRFTAKGKKSTNW